MAEVPLNGERLSCRSVYLLTGKATASDTAVTPSVPRVRKRRTDPRWSGRSAGKSGENTGSAVRSQEIKALNPSRLGANVKVKLAAGYLRERYQGNEDTEQYPTLLHTLVSL